MGGGKGVLVEHLAVGGLLAVGGGALPRGPAPGVVLVRAGRSGRQYGEHKGQRCRKNNPAPERGARDPQRTLVRGRSALFANKGPSAVNNAKPQ